MKNTMIYVRVSSEMRNKMKQYNEINWAELIRKFVQQTLDKLDNGEIQILGD